MKLTPHHSRAKARYRHAIQTVWLVGGLLGLAQAGSLRVASYVQVGKQTKPAFAWCEAKDRILAVTAPSPPLHGADDVRNVSLLRWLKTGSAASTFDYKLGLIEGTAGSTYVGLIPAGFKATRDLSSKYFVQLSNVQQPPSTRMQSVVKFKTMQGENTCRYVPDAAFMGVTGKRTVIVWDEGDAITYTTRNFNRTPGVYVTGGRKRFTTEGGTGYTFMTEDGFTYQVLIDEYRPASGAKLTVTKAGRLKAQESFLAYSVSVPAK